MNKKKDSDSSSLQHILKNKRAYFEYEILDSFEAGLQLQGSEVKSLREGKISLEGAHGRLQEEEVFLYQATIQPYEKAGYCNHDPQRPRKLLLHHSEIRKISQNLKLRGYTLIPLSVYFKNGWAKLKIGLCRGKKLHDKREDLKKKDSLRQIQRGSY
jgi:SsrA-binding protein